MRTALFTLLALLLSACASYSGYGLKPGTSTEGDVLRTMGPPAMAFDNPDGSRELIYPRGPMGNETYIAHVARGGALQSIDQVLSDGNFDSMPLGLTEEEVLRRFGPPRETMAFALSRTHAWDWKYRDLWGYEAIFSVTFDAQGRAVSKFKQRLERSDQRK
jgi:hypothetical protein